MGHELVGTLATCRRPHRAHPRRRARFSSDSTNASLALATVASCFDFNKTTRNKVVTTALDFPRWNISGTRNDKSAPELKSFLQRRHLSALDQILDAIDDQTCLVALSHTSYRSSSD
jgi:selenocysteine lyase/cysteine desulfurase